MQQPGRSLAIEDLFPVTFYLDAVEKVYGKQLAMQGLTPIKLDGDGMLCTRVEGYFDGTAIKFNKGSVANVIRKELVGMTSVQDLPEHTRLAATNLLKAIAGSFA